MVRVKLYGRARQLTGTEDVHIELEGPTHLKGLLQRILKNQELVPSQDVQAILINGRNCIFLDGLDTQVQDGDTIEILPIVTGG